MLENRTKRLIFCTLIALLSLIYMPVMAAKLSRKQEKFVKFLLPKIQKANAKIEKNRTKLLTLQSNQKSFGNLDYAHQAWVKNLAQSYDVDNFNLHSQHSWQQLLTRVDTIPASLVLAQAINESGWGTSRFAREGHNYFGIWCSSPGCGMVPKRRPEGETYEVRRFPSAQASVNTYFHILNTKGAYRGLRRLRAHFREEGKKPNAIELASGLRFYSQRGYAYVRSIRGLINNFQLESVG